MYIQFPPQPATYDVQNLSLKEEGEGVFVSAEFVSGSRSAGGLVVFQGAPTSPDIFRALHRTQSQDTVSTTIPLPPSTYSVYGYDLEENGLPHTAPAITLTTGTSVLTTGIYNIKYLQVLYIERNK